MKKILSFLLVITILLSVLMPVVNANSIDDKSQNNSLFQNRRDLPIINKIKEFFMRIPLINKTVNYIKGLLGLEDEITDMLDDLFDYEPFYESNEKDPKTSKPTDSSISVKINDFDINYKTTEDEFEYEMSFDGTTTGDVKVCYWTIVIYFDDGTNSYYRLWNGPVDQDEENMFYSSIQSTFKGTGPGGDTDWSSFKGRQYIKAKITEQDDVPYDPDKYDDEVDKYPVDVMLFVRAFSDEELTKWNQASKSIFNEMYGSSFTTQNEDEDEENGIDDNTMIIGFVIIVIIVIIVVALLLMRKRKKDND